MNGQVEYHSIEMFIIQKSKVGIKNPQTIITKLKKNTHYKFLKYILWIVEEADETEDRSVEIMQQMKQEGVWRDGRAPTILAEDLSSLPRTHTRWFTTTGNFSSRGTASTSQASMGAVLIYALTHMQTNTNNIISKINKIFQNLSLKKVLKIKKIEWQFRDL